MNKKEFSTLASLMLLSVSGLVTAAPNPVSQDWVSEHVAPLLTTSVWAAGCSSGSPTSATGCYGNAASPGFAKISSGLGGFAAYANLNTTNAPNNSVFIKAFFAGTNTPVGSTSINVVPTGPAVAKCGLFTQYGTGLNFNYGLSNSITNGNIDPGPLATQVFTITPTSNNTIPFVSLATPAVAIPDPLYLVCVGVNATDGSSVNALGSVTAV